MPDCAGTAVVYVTDGEMAGYMANPANGLDGMWNLDTDESLSLGALAIAGRSSTLQKSAGELPEAGRVQMLSAAELGAGHHLRLLQVIGERADRD